MTILIFELLELFGDALWSALQKGLNLAFAYIADALLEMMADLPTAAFIAFPNFSGTTWDTALGWLNWLAPVSDLETALLSYAAAVFAYYVFTRIRKVVESR